MTTSEPVLRITDPEQWEAITSPVRFDIVELLRSIGPSSVTDLARHMGRPADSLYYHIRKLQAVGIVRQDGTRMNMGQAEAVFRLNGSDLEIGDPRAEEIRPYVLRLFSAVLRMTDRATKRAFEEDAIDLDGVKNFCARRDLAWLTDDALERVNEHLDEIGKILEEGRRERTGKLYSMTTFFTPLITSVDPRGRRIPR